MTDPATFRSLVAEFAATRPDLVLGCTLLDNHRGVVRAFAPASVDLLVATVEVDLTDPPLGVAKLLRYNLARAEAA